MAVRLIVGVPAKDEADTVAGVADGVEAAARRLPGWDVELVLAYQDSRDDTLDRWRRPGRLPRRVRRCPPGVHGKGRNVALLLDEAVRRDADYLLLVDADLGGYDPANLVRTVQAAVRDGHGLTLPLWARPHEQGNTTKYLAVPLVYAATGARVREPLAGHALLHHTLVRHLRAGSLPSGYGIDVAITHAALAGGWGVGQVPLTAPAHAGGTATSDRIMSEVATAALARFAVDAPARPDVAWPAAYWRRLDDPRPEPTERDFTDLLARHPAGSAPGPLAARADADGGDVAATWSAHLASALCAVQRGTESPRAAAARLLRPFLVHATHRHAHPPATFADGERDVADLAERVAAQLPRRLLDHAR